ncbi:GNAT family N-acetyltransferase [Mycoplasma sp. 2704]|uniref:GNAT family N-acetyltransferase n=1 Tax=unclassified Mycoplasma TaxID=2683645 RepID=UPI002B1E57EC|nr:GNAT family N-acetyltransferase [Mycoplasma sp. 2704]MEA4134635.1 GNAT family N-acetyltransferase [Mycoplasma sp. 2704]
MTLDLLKEEWFVNNYYIFLYENDLLENKLENNGSITYFENGLVINTFRNDAYSAFISNVNYKKENVEKIINLLSDFSPTVITYGNACLNLVHQISNLNNYEIYNQTIAALDKDDFAFSEAKEEALDKKILIRRVDLFDFDEIKKFLEEENFYPNSRNHWVASYKKYILENNLNYGYIALKDKKVISHACVVYTNYKNAVIWGVATNTEFRGLGLASHLVSLLCKDILNNNLEPLLYYTEEKIGNLYKKLGFKDKAQYFIASKVEN